MKRIASLTVLPAAVVAVVLAACSGGSGGGSDESDGTGGSGTSTGSGSDGGASGAGGGAGSGTELPAVFAKFKTADHTCGSSVTVYRDGDFVVIESNAVPNHGSPYFPNTNSCHEADTQPGFAANPSQISSQSLTFRIPVAPASAATKSATPLGPMGVSINGVPFFNQYAAGRQPLTTEKVSFDQYGGHPQQQNQYHYHVEPVGLTASDGKDALLGFLLDGFPVYGPMENGAAVAESALDEYHGHFGTTADYPSGIYHYHVTSADPYINGNGYYGTPGTVSQ